MAASWSAWPRGLDGRRLAELPLVEAEARVRHNDVGTYSLAVPFTPARWQACGAGRRIEVRRNGRHLIAGPVVERELTVNAEHPGGLIEVTGESDETLLADRIVYPDPTRAGTAQTTASHWTMTGPAESVIKALASQQTGPAARAERRVADLLIEADTAGGTTARPMLRYDNLLAALQTIARDGGRLTFRIEPTVDGRLLRVHPAPDLSATVRYSLGLGNLAALTYRESAPATTYALVGGAGELAGRLQREATTADPLAQSYGRRIEVYVDRRDTSDTAELDKAGAEALTTGLPARALPLTPAGDHDVDPVQLLGALVTVQVGPVGYTATATVVDLVREVRVQLTEDGTDTATPVIGSDRAGAADTLAGVLNLDGLDRRLANLERS